MATKGTRNKKYFKSYYLVVLVDDKQHGHTTKTCFAKIEVVSRFECTIDRTVSTGLLGSVPNLLSVVASLEQ